ncbi:MAG: IS110 family transposase [Methylococcales bacterium]
MNITTVGIDLAKNVFHAVGHDAQGREKMKKRLSRPQVLKHFVNLSRCLVGMEAGAGAHHFARELIKLGHEVKLIPPQYVKAYLRGQKNDYNDARAIADAVRAPHRCGLLR